MSKQKSEIILISALAESNRAIGKNGKLPWPYLAEDSNRFQQLTKGYPVIMGRKTWEHDLEGSPLVERSNIVITSKKPPNQNKHSDRKQPFELAFVSSFQEALKKARNADSSIVNTDRIYIIGGATIYAQALEIADTWELTPIEGDYEGDTFFPEYQHLVGTQFEKVNEQKRSGYRFETYKKIAA
ncbi:MAG: dihydrofolate reductase [Xenococcaceae cyanobacterium]